MRFPCVVALAGLMTFAESAAAQGLLREDRQAPQAAPQATRAPPKHWFFAFHMGWVSEQTSPELEQAMRESGFADTVPASFFGPASASPESPSPGFSSSISFEAGYRIRESWGVGLVYIYPSTGSTMGYHSVNGSDGQFMFIDHSVRTVAATASLTYRNIRGSVGPAFNRLRISQSVPGGGPSETQSKLGFIALVGASVPAASHVFLDVELHYRYVGQATVGPYTSTAAISHAPATFPATTVPFNDWSFAIGPGIRF